MDIGLIVSVNLGVRRPSAALLFRRLTLAGRDSSGLRVGSTKGAEGRRTPRRHSRLRGHRDTLGTYHCFSEALHLFKLRTALQQHQIDAGILEFSNSFCNLFGRAHQS